MKRKNTNKAQMRVVEAILASFIIIFALSFVNFFALTPTSQKYEITDLEKVGYNALHDLDVQGLLVPMIYDNHWTDLKAALGVILPTDVYYNITVLDLYKNPINDVSISFGSSEIFTTSKSISSINYVIVGYPNRDISSYNYEPRIINMQLIRG
jgi:hypothetical protein